MRNIIAQVIGFLALALSAFSFQQNTQRRIMIWQSLSCALFIVHFLLLGAYTGALLNLVAMVRSIVYSQRGNKWADSLAWLFVFWGAIALSGVFSWKGPLSLLPLAAMMLTTLSMRIKIPKYIRLLTLPSAPLWLVYNVVNKSIAGVFTEIFALVSILVAMIRLDILKRPPKTEEASSDEVA